MRKDGTLKFTLDRMNTVLIETREAFKLSSTKINQEVFKKTCLPPIYIPEKGTDHQYCLTATQMYNSQK